MVAKALSTLLAVPYGLRAFVVVALLVTIALLDWRLHGKAATRPKEYATWLVLALLGAAFGVVNDLVTSRIGPVYFELGKGLGAREDAGFTLAVITLGAEAGGSAALLLGGLLLFANSVNRRWPPLPYARVVKLAAWAPGLAVVLAPVAALITAWDPQGLAADLAVSISADEVRSFLLVQRAHVGVYIGALVGTGIAAWRVLALRARNAARAQ